MLALGASTLAVRAMLSGLEALGLDGAQLRRGGRIDQERLADPDRYLLPPAVIGMWRTATRLWGRPDLGLRAGAAVPLGAFGIFDYLGATAPTIGDALGQFCRYFALGTTMLRYELHDQPDGVHLRLHHVISTALLPDGLRDYSLSAVASHLRMISGAPPTRAELIGRGLTDQGAYREVLGCDVWFRRKSNALVFSPERWAQPMPRRDPVLGALLERHARDLMDRVPRAGIEEIVRREVVKMLPAGEPALEEIARRLAVGDRTLQRRLTDGGLTLSAIIDETRRALALGYLRERSLSIGEVALLLGYSEPSAFNRAFRRWTGVTPSAHRRRAG